MTADAPAIYLMRNDHTFRRLPSRWSDAVVVILWREYVHGETAPLVGIPGGGPSVVRRLDEPFNAFVDRVRREIYREHP